LTPRDFGSCKDGNKSRINYVCSELTNFKCQPYTEIVPCEEVKSNKTLWIVFGIIGGLLLIVRGLFWRVTFPILMKILDVSLVIFFTIILFIFGILKYIFNFLINSLPYIAEFFIETLPKFFIETLPNFFLWIWNKISFWR